MGYYGYCRYYSDCNIIPMIQRISNMFFGHKVSKHNIYMHYVTELNLVNIVNDLTILEVLYFNKIIGIKINLSILLLVLLVLLLFN
jgi:hypothetical protein